MDKDGLNWMNMKIGSSESQIELNEYRNWIEWIQKLMEPILKLNQRVQILNWMDLKIVFNE